MRILVLPIVLATLAFEAGAKEPAPPTPVPEHARRLIVVAEPHAPYEMRGRQGTVVGYDIDLLSVIFRQLGVDFEVRLLPWRRAWAQMQSGEADVSLSTSANAERALYAYFPTQSMWEAEFVFFTRADSVSLCGADIEQATRSGLTVGVIAGNSYHPDFWASFPYRDPQRTKLHPQLQEGLSSEVNFRKLAKSRFELFPFDRIAGVYEIHRLGLQDSIAPCDKVLFTKVYSAAFSKASSYPGIQQLVARFDEELAAMKRSGEHQKILGRWATEMKVGR